jgi:hypothetical protein
MRGTSLCQSHTKRSTNSLRRASNDGSDPF